MFRIRTLLLPVVAVAAIAGAAVSSIIDVAAPTNAQTQSWVSTAFPVAQSSFATGR